MTIGIYSDMQWDNRWHSRKCWGGWGRDPCWSCEVHKEHRCVALCGTRFRTNYPELVLDFKGCNLNCKFCWAYNIKKGRSIRKTPEQVIADLFCRLKTLRNDDWIRKRWKDFKSLRITGNEPTLQWQHLNEVLKTLNNREKLLSVCQRVVEQEVEYFVKTLTNLEIIIQTNGIAIGKPGSEINLNTLRDLKDIKIRFEVSFKGVNPKQFAWLTGASSEMFYWQCDGFAKLWALRNENIEVVPVLGINHASKVRRYPDIGVWIIDEEENKMNFNEYDVYFVENVLALLEGTSVKFETDSNNFEEFGGMDKALARQVIASIHEGTIHKHMLPSEVKARHISP